MSEPIRCLVFTKDRPLQLDAFLRSAQKYAPYEWPPAVSLCAGEDFQREVIRFLRTWRRVVFHTDDDVWFAPWNGPATAIRFPHPTVIHSFRLGRNTTYCHPVDAEQAVPGEFPWKWREAELDFNYPLSLNGTVYRSADILPLLDFSFSNPTELEAGLAARAADVRFKPEWMTAPVHSCCVSLPHNRVSSSNGARAGCNPEWSAAALQAKYEDGWRIDLDAMDWSNIIGAHQEVPLKFYRP